MKSGNLKTRDWSQAAKPLHRWRSVLLVLDRLKTEADPSVEAIVSFSELHSFRCWRWPRMSGVWSTTWKNVRDDCQGSSSERRVRLLKFYESKDVRLNEVAHIAVDEAAWAEKAKDIKDNITLH